MFKPTHSALPALSSPLVVTTIDAEESFDWMQPLTRNARNLAAMGQQYLGHEIFGRHGIVPIYLVTYPVVAEEDGYRPLLELLQNGKCEIGTQLHPWVTPPFEETLCLENSFSGNLPAVLEFEKLSNLTDAIAQRFGIRPRVYRAGRYGLGPHTFAALRRLGYLIDTSVVPEQNYASESGPSFLGLPAHPYWTDDEEALLEVPLTSAFVGRFGQSNPRLSRALYRDGHSHRVARGALARARVLERIRLTPEGTHVDDAIRLVRTLLDKGVRVFTISYHAPSLVVGNTPYVRSIEDRDQLLRWLDEFYEFFLNTIGGRPVTTTQLYEMASKPGHQKP